LKPAQDFQSCAVICWDESTSQSINAMNTGDTDEIENRMAMVDERTSLLICA
jgi:hypothetical protein